MDEIDRNSDLSPEGKERQRRNAAAESIDGFESSKTLAKARQAVAVVVDKWREKIGLSIKPAMNIHEAMLYSKIWDRLHELKGSVRMAWLETNGSDPMVASALLTSPACVSGISEVELSFLRQKVEQHLAPEIAKTRDETLKALQEAEHGWQRAIDVIAERAGMSKAADGTWSAAA